MIDILQNPFNYGLSQLEIFYISCSVVSPRIHVVFRIVPYASEPSLESNRMPNEAVYPGPLQRTQVSLHITVLGFILLIVHRELTEKTIVNEIYLEGDEQNPRDREEPSIHGED